jgi:hypothetical protein
MSATVNLGLIAIPSAVLKTGVFAPFLLQKSLPFFQKDLFWKNQVSFISLYGEVQSFECQRIEFAV